MKKKSGEKFHGEFFWWCGPSAISWVKWRIGRKSCNMIMTRIQYNSMFTIHRSSLIIVTDMVMQFPRIGLKMLNTVMFPSFSELQVGE